MPGWGWAESWSPSQPFSCAAEEAQLSLSAQLHLSQIFCRQEKGAHIQRSYCLYKICASLPTTERWLCRFLWNTLVVVANFCLPEFGKYVSELASNSSSTINEIMTKMLEIIACRYMAVHELQDLRALPRSSVQPKASLTSWLNANKMVNAVSSLYV